MGLPSPLPSPHPVFQEEPPPPQEALPSQTQVQNPEKKGAQGQQKGPSPHQAPHSSPETSSPQMPSPPGDPQNSSQGPQSSPLHPQMPPSPREVLLVALPQTLHHQDHQAQATDPQVQERPASSCGPLVAHQTQLQT